MKEAVTGLGLTSRQEKTEKVEELTDMQLRRPVGHMNQKTRECAQKRQGGRS